MVAIVYRYHLNKITLKNDKYDCWFRAINMSNLYIAVCAYNLQSQAKLKTVKGQCQVLRQFMKGLQLPKVLKQKFIKTTTFTTQRHLKKCNSCPDEYFNIQRSIKSGGLNALQ